MAGNGSIDRNGSTADESYFSVSLEVPSDLSDLMTGVLYSLGARGMETVSPDMSNMPGVKPPSPGFERMIAYFPDNGTMDKDELTAVVERRLAAIPDELRSKAGHGKVDAEEVRAVDWSKLFRSFFKPLESGNRLFLRPSWEKASPGPGRLEIVMDPGMAFGTGTHETTRLCLEWLEARVEGRRVLDVGTGSGVLAIAAAKLEATMVTAVENDPTALDAARKNLEMNDVSGQVELVSRLDDVSGTYDVVLANILAHTLVELSEDLAALMAPGADLALSGILVEQQDMVRSAYERIGFEPLGSRVMGPWSLLHVRKR